MTYETISVRMNRSDRNIRWGFSIRQQADGLIIDRVDPESLSDRAGVKHNDKVEQINGRPARGLDANTANRLIDDSFDEVRLSLQRFVTSHTTLPWTLSEKDNKMVVEDMKTGFGSGFGNGTTHFNQNSSNQFSGNSSYNTAPASNFGTSHINSGNSHQKQHQSNYHSSSTYNSSSGHQNYGGTNIPTTIIPSRAPFSSQNQGYNRNDQHTTSTTNYINPSQYNYNSTPAGFGTHHNTSSTHNSDQGHNGNEASNRFSNSKPTAPPPTSYSYNNGGTVQNYGTGSGGTPLNQLTFINTSHNNPSSNDGLSPGGKVFYHSPSGRNRNDLSPGASIHHLQYNSPMNLYSSEAVAEQYEQQTGKSPDGPVPHEKQPAYLTSETKKLIEEEARGRFNRGKSPSSQSSCFKRISHAVGADN